MVEQEAPLGVSVQDALEAIERFFCFNGSSAERMAEWLEMTEWFKGLDGGATAAAAGGQDEGHGSGGC